MIRIYRASFLIRISVQPESREFAKENSAWPKQKQRPTKLRSTATGLTLQRAEFPSIPGELCSSMWSFVRTQTPAISRSEKLRLNRLAGPRKRAFPRSRSAPVLPQKSGENSRVVTPFLQLLVTLRSAEPDADLCPGRKFPVMS